MRCSVWATAWPASFGEAGPLHGACRRVALRRRLGPPLVIEVVRFAGVRADPVRPAFLAVEGIDGCGKTGISRSISQHFEDRGVEVVATREPGGSPAGEQIRHLILSGSDASWDPYSELLLMTAARVEHVKRIILPALARGETIVSDRYVGSTVAYQGAGRGIPQEFILELHRTAVGDLWPDLTIVLDLEVEIGLARSRRRLQTISADEGRFESLDVGFHGRVRRSFLHQAAIHPDRHVVIDASRSPDDVRRATLAAIDCWFATRGANRGYVQGV